MYLRYSDKDCLTTLEKKYQVKIEFDKNGIAIRDCPNKALSLIEKEIKKACNKKIIGKHKTEAFPGLKKLFEQKQFKLFQFEIEAIQGINIYKPKLLKLSFF